MGCYRSKRCFAPENDNSDINTHAYQDKVIYDRQMQCECNILRVKEFLLQQNNASCDKRIYPSPGYYFLDWPSNSPVLSLIETVWSIVKRCMGKRIFGKKNAQDIWYSIGIDELKAQYSTCPIESKSVLVQRVV